MILLRAQRASLHMNVKGVPWLALWGLIVVGCAAFSNPSSVTTTWRCDSAADAAVERGEWEDAAEAHERLLDHEPRNGLALYHLGYILGKMGDREAEIDFYLKAIDSGYDQDDQLYFNLGMAYGEIDPTAAIEAFEHAIRLNPRNADNHFGLALMAEAFGQPDMAVDALKTALELQADHLEAMLLLARIYLDQSLWSDAAQLLDKVLEKDPYNEEAQELLEILNFRQRIEYQKVSLPFSLKESKKEGAIQPDGVNCPSRRRSDPVQTMLLILLDVTGDHFRAQCSAASHSR